jgi:hypothetical protein
MLDVCKNMVMTTCRSDAITENAYLSLPLIIWILIMTE